MMIRLSRHIEILLLSNDCVIVPGFGGFMAHHVDAHKDKADNSFLPPKRCVGFNPKLTINDSLLAQSYVEAYDISYPEAVMQIEDEVRELCQRIQADGRFEFNGIGVITLNEDGNYEFSPCEAGILSPKIYGLGSFQMKTVKELTTYPDSPKSQIKVAINKEESNKGHKSAARIVALWRNIAVACIAVILFLLLPSPLTNNAKLAGTNIDTQLLDKIMPKDITTGQEKVNESVKMNVKAIDLAGTSKEDKEKDKDKEVPSVPDNYYSIVVASHVTTKNANAYVKDLHNRGYKDAFVSSNSHVKVLMGHYPTQEAASKALNRLNNAEEFAGAWIIKK